MHACSRQIRFDGLTCLGSSAGIATKCIVQAPSTSALGASPRLHIRHAGHCAGPDAPLPCARGRSRHASALLRAGVVTKGGLRPSRPLSVHPRAARLAARVPPASRGPRRLCRLLRPGRPLSRGQRRRRGFHWRYLWGTAAAGVAPYAMRRPDEGACGEGPGGLQVCIRLFLVTCKSPTVSRSIGV